MAKVCLNAVNFAVAESIGQVLGLTLEVSCQSSHLARLAGSLGFQIVVGLSEISPPPKYYHLDHNHYHHTVTSSVS